MQRNFYLYETVISYNSKCTADCLYILWLQKPVVHKKTIAAEIPIMDFSKSIVVIDAGDVYTPGLAVTKKREAVVTSIKNIYCSDLPDVLRKDLQLSVFRDTILTDEEKNRLLQNDDAVRLKLATKYGANIFIILQNYEEVLVRMK